MIPCALDDVEDAVNGFQENDAHELMGKGELGHRESKVTGGLDLGRESVRGTDNKTDLGLGKADFLQMRSKLLGGKLLSLDAHCDLIRAIGHGGKYCLGFLGKGSTYVAVGRIVR